MINYIIGGLIVVAAFSLWQLASLKRRVEALAEAARVEVLYAQALAQASDRVKSGLAERTARGEPDDGSFAAALRALSGIDGRVAQEAVVRSYCNMSTSHAIGWTTELGEGMKNNRAEFGNRSA